MQTNINLYDIWKIPLYHNPNAFFAIADIKRGESDTLTQESPPLPNILNIEME
jgi:hypothetical protein